MSLNILSAKKHSACLKSTVQSIGELGFSGAMAPLLNLEAGGIFRFVPTDNELTFPQRLRMRRRLLMSDDNAIVA